MEENKHLHKGGKNILSVGECWIIVTDKWDVKTIGNIGCRFLFVQCSSVIDFKVNMKRRVLRYQRVNQNPYIEEELTTQWPKEKVQKDKQRSTKHTHKTKDRVTPSH
jgi:hypothetical protein